MAATLSPMAPGRWPPIKNDKWVLLRSSLVAALVAVALAIRRTGLGGHCGLDYDLRFSTHSHFQIPLMQAKYRKHVAKPGFRDNSIKGSRETDANQGM